MKKPIMGHEEFSSDHNNYHVSKEPPKNDADSAEKLNFPQQTNE